MQSGYNDGLMSLETLEKQQSVHAGFAIEGKSSDVDEE